MVFLPARFAALWTKSWREARAAFWGCFILTCLNSWLALDRLHDAVANGTVTHPSTFDLYDGTIRVWAIAYAILGAGSLLWERRLGGQDFTRILPVREFHVNLMRALVGVFIVVILSTVPGECMNALHRFIFPDFVVPQAFSFVMLSLGLGIATYGMAMFAGSLMSNVWAGIAAGWILPTAISGLLSPIPATQPLAPMRLLRRYGANPPAPVEWPLLLTYAGAGILAMVLASYQAERSILKKFRS
ncbi:MAG: hypothetical protein JST65_20550 [Acidobacteria bacterium]|nr:hypothetical protein [Acidobacteriota bacterium]